jgi:hypothetical protein
MYHNIPMELREIQQWVCWRYEEVNGRRTKVPYTPDGTRKADVNDPRTWGTFYQAASTAASPTMSGIGFVLTENDPYTGIDIDDKPENPASPEERIVHQQILELFQSYTERSVGGNGYHIIIRGKINGGRDRGHVGVYSTQRYLTFTGEVVRNAPIAEYQELLDKLVAQMPQHEQVSLEDTASHLSDRELFDMAMNAANGAKFDELCRGDWQAMGYPSQSEADFALLSILAFYTRDNEQVRRLFRYSGLGQRDKAMRDNRYIDAALRKIRAKETPMADLEAIAQDAAAMVAAHTAKAAPPALPAPVATEAPTRAPVRAAVGSYALPPGLVGEVARYIYSSAHRPTQEVALCAAVGFLAGIVGRTFNISGTGLNQYLLLVAKTGMGKEDGPKGVERLVAAIRPHTPMVDDFMGPGAFASGQALIRVLDQRPSFVSFLGEFGLTLQAINDPRAPAAVVMLRRVLLDLYSKSGWSNVLRSTAYSDSEKNTKTIHAPNVTFVGDTTPETFYDNLSHGDIADGLIPRLQIVEHVGTRPSRNREAAHAPDAALVGKLTDMVVMALTMANNNACAAVQVTADALAMLDAFDEECDEQMRSATGSGELELWNRAHLKALKLAGLLAVGVNPHQPTVTTELAEWAIAFTRRGTEAVLARFQTGNVGTGEAKQGAELRRVVNEFYSLPPAQLKRYKVKPELQKAGIVPYAYLVMRVTQLASFYKDRRGTVRALKDTLDMMVQTEELGQVPPTQALSKFAKREALFYRGERW